VRTATLTEEHPYTHARTSRGGYPSNGLGAASREDIHPTRLSRHRGHSLPPPAEEGRRASGAGPLGAFALCSPSHRGPRRQQRPPAPRASFKQGPHLSSPPWLAHPNLPPHTHTQPTPHPIHSTPPPTPTLHTRPTPHTPTDLLEPPARRGAKPETARRRGGPCALWSYSWGIPRAALPEAPQYAWGRTPFQSARHLPAISPPSPLHLPTPPTSPPARAGGASGQAPSGGDGPINWAPVVFI